MVKRIPLSGKAGKGKYTLVDEVDFEELSKHRWFLATRSVATNVRDDEGVFRKVAIHRMIMEPESWEVVDHIDRDVLNNTRANLRVCTQQENTMNRPASKGSNQYKGVSFSKYNNKYVAYISLDGKRKHIGYFEKDEDAARAYDYYAEKMFGEFAYLNFPDEEQTKPEKRKTTSRYRGIYWDNRDKKFIARFHHKKKPYAVGYFDTEKEAVLAFNKKVREVLGEDAHLKLIPEGDLEDD